MQEELGSTKQGQAAMTTEVWEKEQFLGRNKFLKEMAMGRLISKLLTQLTI